MLTERRFQHLLVLCVLLGVGVGLFSALFALAWHALHDLLWHHLPAPVHRIWISTAAGLIVGLILYWLFDPGNMSTIVRHFHEHGRLPPRDNLPIVPASIIGLVGGQSAGPEGMLTQVCGSMGALIGDRLGRPAFVRVLTLAGMGAGFGAFLCAPVGGAILWLEMLHRRGLEYYEAVIPTILTSFVGYLVMVGVLGTRLIPPWRVPMPDQLVLWDLAITMGVAVTATVAAVVYARLFRLVGWGFAAVRLPVYVRTTLAGLIIGVAGFLLPLTYFYGGQTMNAVLRQPLPLGLVLATLVVKMLTASVTIKGHWQGGLIIPHMLMGALLGKALAIAVPTIDPVLAMLGGAAAFNAAATQTPISSALIVLALTGYGNPIPLFLASLVGYLAGGRIVLIENKVSRSETPGFHLVEPDLDAPGDADDQGEPGEGARPQG